MKTPRFDFLVIAAPECWWLRPISEPAKAFCAAQSHPLGLGPSLLFRESSGFYSALDALSSLNLRIETL